MLVDHLGDRVAQQDDVLIERLDVPLQLDLTEAPTSDARRNMKSVTARVSFTGFVLGITQTCA